MLSTAIKTTLSPTETNIVARRLKKHAVLGMQLADVTPELKSAYDLYFEHGAVILDPGNDSDRLKIGRLAEGYCFWKVGHTRVGSVREFVNQILIETGGPDAAKNAVHGVRVVYRFSTVDGDGNMTQYLKLTKDDLKHLQNRVGPARGPGPVISSSPTSTWWFSQASSGRRSGKKTPLRIDASQASVASILVHFTDPVITSRLADSPPRR